MAHLPVIPGHEVVGKIVKMGEGRNTDIAGEPIKPGDRIMWPHVSCGKCFSVLSTINPTYAKKDLAMASAIQMLILISPESFAEYEYVIPNADVIKIPDELSNEEVVGASCAFRTARSKPLKDWEDWVFKAASLSRVAAR